MPDPASSGFSTSEGKLTVIAVIIGTVLESVAGVLHALQDAGHAAPWFPAVLAVVGVVLQVATLLGYTKGRVLLKATSGAPVASPPK